MGIVKDIIEDFLLMTFPESCHACGGSILRNESMICTQCRFALPYTKYHLLANNPVSAKLEGRFPFENAWAYLRFSKGGKTQRLIHQLKYRGARELGSQLGLMYGHDLKSSGVASGIDLILSVPLHPLRLRQRGYNQAACFAEGLSEALGIPWSDALMLRNVYSISQTKKNRAKRTEGIDDIFSVKTPSELEGRHILIADDVITTGATLEACSLSVIKASANVKISLAAIATA